VHPALVEVVPANVPFGGEVREGGLFDAMPFLGVENRIRVVPGHDRGQRRCSLKPEWQT
jgi:hypothetical protein